MQLRGDPQFLTETYPHNPSSLRIKALDGLRGVAAISVVIYHYLAHGPNLYPSLGRSLPIAGYGGEGIRLFFVISGFVIALTLRRSSPKTFLISRFIRLYPCYWACLSITLIITSVWGLPGQKRSLTEAATNITMIQPIFSIPNADGSYWTLTVELFFYLLCAVLWFTGLLAIRKLPYTLTAIALAFILGAILLPQEYITLHTLIDNVPWFLLGIVALRIYEGDPRVSLSILLPAAIVLGGCLYDARAAICAGLSFLLVLFVLIVNPLLTTNRIFQFLGAVSYPLYLLHQEIGYIVLQELAKVGVSRPIADLLAISLVVFSAYVITRCVDTPVRSMLRKKLLPT